MERDVGRHQSVYVCSTYMQLLLSSWGAYAYMHSPSHSNAIHVINKLKKKKPKIRQSNQLFIASR